MPRPPFPSSLPEFQRILGTDEACFRFVVASRWPDGFRCPACGGTESFQRGDRLALQCRSCAVYTTATAGTVMHRSHTPLRLWLLAAYLLVTDKRGISAAHLRRTLGLRRYETAFQMLHKLRAAMVSPGRGRLHGRVEADEFFVGGRGKGVDGGTMRGKARIAGALEVRAAGPGRLRLAIVPDNRAPTLHAFLRQHVEPGTTIATDGLHSYQGLEGYVHEPHKPTPESKPLPHFHTAVSNLKTWLRGTHHGGVRRKHLQAYLEEFTFRFNRRANLQAAFQTLLGIAPQVRAATYRGLYATGQGAAQDSPGTPDPQR